MSQKKRRSRRKTYKDLPGYGTLRTVKGAKDFDQMVKCLASFPFDMSAMEQMSDEDQVSWVWTCCYTNQFEKNTGHIAALWNSNADRVNSEDEDPLQVDSAITKGRQSGSKSRTTTPPQKRSKRGRRRETPPENQMRPITGRKDTKQGGKRRIYFNTSLTWDIQKLPSTNEKEN